MPSRIAASHGELEKMISSIPAKLGLAEQDSFHLHPTQVSKPKQSEKMQKENTQSPLQIHDQKLKGDDGQTGFGATRPNAT
jgi:hypothetical protein